MILYSNNKTEDYTEKHCEELYRAGITGLICDFEPDIYLTHRLRNSGIVKSYYREKIYYYTPNDPQLITDIKQHVERSAAYGFHGIALDLEAYSNSIFWKWYEEDYYTLGEKIGGIIRKQFNTVAIYPEFLGGEKYGDIGIGIPAYIKLLYGLSESGVNINILMERTYNVWKPWELLYFYKRAKKDIGFTADFYIGIWPDTMPWVCKKIQKFFAWLISGNKIFYYTERKY